MFALSAALLGARFRSNDASLLGAPGEDGCNADFEVPAGVNMGRRRSRAVLYQLSGHYKPEKIKTKLKLNNVSALTLFVTRTHTSRFMYTFPLTKVKHLLFGIFWAFILYPLSEHFLDKQ